MALPLVLLLSLFAAPCHEFTLGGIFRAKTDDHLRLAFGRAIAEANNRPNATHKLTRAEVLINANATHSDLANAVCSLVSNGALGLVGPLDPDRAYVLESMAQSVAIPFFKTTWSGPRKAEDDFSHYMLDVVPSVKDFNAVIVSLLLRWKWPQLMILYDHEYGLLKFQRLITSHKLKEMRLSVQQLLPNDERYLKTMKVMRDSGYKYFLIDVHGSKLRKILQAALQMGMVSIEYHFLLGSMDLLEYDLSDFSHNHLRITAFNLVDNATRLNDPVIAAVRRDWKEPSWFPLTDIAFMRDAVFAFSNGGSSASASDLEKAAWPTCDASTLETTPYKFGETLFNNIAYTGDKNGTTGRLEFRRSRRWQPKIDIFQMTYDGQREKLGGWDFHKKVLDVPKARAPLVRTNDGLFVKKSTPRLKVTTIIEAPYVMFKKGVSRDSPNAIEGFCVELLKKLAKDLNFEYELHLVGDGLYGNVDANGSWDGMIGEILRGEAHMAVAPLTVTYRRAQAVEFTKPFLQLGISILFKIPGHQSPGLMSFMHPLSMEVWVYILISFIAATLILWIVARVSPNQWFPHPVTEQPTNEYTLINALWYNMAIIFKGTCSISPRDHTTRLLGSILWIFTLIVVSAYTANLAAVLTVDRRWIPIKSIDQLANQTSVTYGVLDGGSTMQFFNESKIETHNRMWAYMLPHRDQLFVRNNSEGIRRVSNGNYAYLMESTSLEYAVKSSCDLTQVGGVLGSKGYGIAAKKGFEWTEEISRKILDYGEKGILEYDKRHWWEHVRTPDCEQIQRATMKKGRISLNMEYVAGLFLVLLGGLVLSVCIVLIEFTVKTRNHKAKHKTGTQESICSQMASELCFALQLHPERRRHSLHRCETCDKLHDHHRSLRNANTTSTELANLNDDNGSNC